jgi:inner membrane protein
LDNLTHSLFGLTLARTPLSRAGRGTTAALLLASNAPDIDIVTTAGGALRYLEWHRGPTHGPLGVVGLAFATAGLVWIGRRVWDRGRATGGPGFLALWMVSILGVSCHILMDLPTSYGTRALSPFSWTWFAEDWMPIIDVYLLAILAACLWFGRSARIRYAVLAFALMGAYYGVRATSHHAALVDAPEVFGASLPPPCTDIPPPGVLDRWPKASLPSPRAMAARSCRLEIAAMPDFLSPFRWRLIAQLPNAYEVRDINLLDRYTGGGASASSGRRRSERYPNQWTPAVMRAATSEVGRIFLGFSRFPAARSLREADGTTRVRWGDMRFASGELRNGERPVGIFSAAVDVGPNGDIRTEHLGRARESDDR